MKSITELDAETAFCGMAYDLRERFGMTTTPTHKLSRDKLIERHTDACMAVMTLAQAAERLRRMGMDEGAMAMEQWLRRVDIERSHCAMLLFPKRNIRRVK